MLQPKDTLGIVAGQELPKRGRCTHYGKSYRWFRSVPYNVLHLNMDWFCLQSADSAVAV